MFWFIGGIGRYGDGLVSLLVMLFEKVGDVVDCVIEVVVEIDVIIVIEIDCVVLLIVWYELWNIDGVGEGFFDVEWFYVVFMG